MILNELKFKFAQFVEVTISFLEWIMFQNEIITSI